MTEIVSFLKMLAQSIIKFISDNAETLFSGIGVVVLVYFLTKSKIFLGSQSEKVFAAKSPKHRVVLVTGLTSAGKDTLLSHVSKSTDQYDRPIYFLTKHITREPREEELVRDGEERSLAYDVKKVAIDELTADNFVGVRKIYGNYIGFSKKEIVDYLKQQSGTTIVLLHSFIPDIMGIRKEIELLVEHLKVENSDQIDVSVELALIDAPMKQCWHRLSLRGLPEKSRRGRKLDGNNYAEQLKNLKVQKVFKITIDNSDINPIQKSSKQLLEYFSGAK